MTETDPYDGHRQGPAGCCAGCGQEADHLEMDHIVPRVDGGEHHLRNIQWLCPSCHKVKSIREMTGRPHSAERIENIRLAKSTPEAKERTRQIHLGRKRSPETCARTSAAAKLAWARRKGVA